MYSPELTNEWLSLFYECKKNGDRLSQSIFWRLAIHVLPEGVNPDDERVKAAIAEIKEACEQ